MPILADLDDFLARHRPHGPLTGDARPLTSTGYTVIVACSCGVTFERWITPDEAVADDHSPSHLMEPS